VTLTAQTAGRIRGAPPRLDNDELAMKPRIHVITLADVDLNRALAFYSGYFQDPTATSGRFSGTRPWTSPLPDRPMLSSIALLRTRMMSDGALLEL
jgi:hypothetical protein